MRQPPAAVTDEAVMAYEGMVSAHAARFTRLPLMQSDYDDFRSVGLEAVWKAQRDGFYPGNVVVTNAMRDWAKTRRRQLSGQSPLADADEELAA